MNLIDAVRTEPLENIKSIVESKGIPVDSFWLDYIVLNTALECRRKDVANYLLAKNCRVNKFTLTVEAASTPLHNAVILGDKDLVIELLKRKASIIAVDAQGNTPLHLAFIRREEQIIDAILNVIQETENYTNLKNSTGVSHMHVACTRKNSFVISRFLKTELNIEHSVREDSESWAGYTSLHFATKFKSSIAVKLLMQAEANCKAKNAYGQTPLQLANEDLVESSIIVDSLSMENDRWCPTMSHFHLACLKDDPTTLQSFIDKGVDVHMPVYHLSAFCPNYSSLHFAVQSNCEENVKLLLSHKVEDDCFNEYYQTPLHLSLYMNNLKMTELLYKDPKLLENRSDVNGLDYLDVAVARNDVAQVNRYLKEGDDVNKRVTYERQKFYRYTPLHFAVLYQNIDVAQLLVDRGADVDASDGARHGTPLHLALEVGGSEMVKFLLARNANPLSRRPYDGATTIHVLVESYVRCKANDESLMYVKRLVKLGVDINAKTKSGCTALHLACLYGNAKCAEFLLEFGADINITNKSGKTPLECWVPMNAKGLPNDAGKLVEVLYHHTQNLKALGMEVHVRNENFCKKLISMRSEWYPENSKFRNEELQKMEQKRQDEIAKLKITKFTSMTSLKDFLMFDVKHAAAYVRNDILKKIVEDEEIIGEFPVYGYLIKLKFMQASQKKTKRSSDEMLGKTNVGCQTIQVGFEPIKKQCME